MYPYQITSLQQYHQHYKASIDSPAQFWAGIAQYFSWHRQPTQVLNWNFIEPNIEWYADAQLNITVNALDRHLDARANEPAIIWEPNSTNEAAITLTYKQLYTQVNACATMLRQLGVCKGDRVCIYMSMVPELAVAVLACARIGAIHSVVFGGFSAQSIADRLQDADATFIITQDAAYRGNKHIPLKAVVDEALQQPNNVQKVIVYNRCNTHITMQNGRDIWWHTAMDDVMSKQDIYCEPVVMNAEDPLFILYTSGSTGKPKGVVHTCAGYMVYTTYTFVNVFQYTLSDVYFCTADIGWVTGHSYLLYGPLCAGATTVMYEGIPTWPTAGRLWDVVDKHKVNILYTAPTAIRSLMACGLQPLQGKQLTSLKVLGTVGEPINEEAWQWYFTHIGKGKCPIVDTWWQTETGGIMMSNLAGVTPHKPAHATLPLPGIQPILVNEQGIVVQGSDAAKGELPHEIINGNLCIKHPWPSILRTTWGNHERCKLTYFSTYPQLYFTGDGCFRDTEGNYRITGRVDDVLNVSGHRIGTAELENAINSYTQVIESAVVGYPHDVKGQGIYAFVICNSQMQEVLNINEAIIACVVKQIGAIAKPDKIQIVSGLPKTRSGKIMRRILRKIAEGEYEQIGDTSTLLDPTIVAELIEGRKVNN
jgi:acetyl-CoA synthetase